MNPIEFVVKLLATAWPFVKEMVLEGHSLKHALVFNRRRAIFGIVIMTSFFFNIVNLGADARMMRILNSYVELQRSFKALKQSDDALKTATPQTVSCKPDQSVAPDAASATPVNVVQTGDAGYQLTRSTFALLNAQH